MSHTHSPRIADHKLAGLGVDEAVGRRYAVERLTCEDDQRANRLCETQDHIPSLDSLGMDPDNVEGPHSPAKGIEGRCGKGCEDVDAAHVSKEVAEAQKSERGGGTGGEQGCGREGECRTVQCSDMDVFR